MKFKNGYLLKDHAMITTKTVEAQIDQFYMGSVQIVSTSATGSIVIEKSNDGINWVNVASPAIGIGTTITDILQITFKHIRIVYTGGLAGTIDVLFYGKGA